MTERVTVEDEFWEVFADHLFSEERLDAAPEEVEQVLSLTGIESGTVLDMPCGVGRHAIELAKRGFTVTGVDRAETYLERARERADTEDVDVKFVHEDMREFRQEESFDAILHLWNSFGYFADEDDNRQVLENFHASLNDGGVLVMDVLGKEVIEPGERSWEEKDDGTLILYEYTVTNNYSWMDNRWIMIKEGEKQEYHPSYRIYAATELTELLQDVGFSSVETYGDFDGSPYDGDAERLKIVARK
jgi:SAM-dependent methyltransferase